MLQESVPELLPSTPDAPGVPEPQDDAGDCRYVLSDDITSPTLLVNTDTYCDYLLDGWVEVSSLLQIEPGVVIRASADANLVIDGGEIAAVGNAQQRIVMEGLSHVSGSGKALRSEVHVIRYLMFLPTIDSLPMSYTACQWREAIFRIWIRVATIWA